VSARQLYDGSDRPDSDSLLRRRSQGRSLDLASTLSAPPAAEPSAAPWCLQSLLIQGSGAPDVHVSLVTSGGQRSCSGCCGGQGNNTRAHGGKCCRS
jgi:hypothetical protein